MIQNSGLLEFPARGNTLSWEGRRGKGKGAVMIRCRLEQALANEEMHTLFPCSYTEYLKMVGSDHHPVVAVLEDNFSKKKMGQFRFGKRWIGQEGLMDSIVAGWTESQEGRIVDFVTKITNCRHEISSWRKDNQPYGRTKLKNFSRLWKKSKCIKIDHKSRFLRFRESCRKLIRMRRNISIRKVEICGTHQEILIPSFTMH